MGVIKNMGKAISKGYQDTKTEAGRAARTADEAGRDLDKALKNLEKELRELRLPFPIPSINQLPRDLRDAAIGVLGSQLFPALFGAVFGSLLVAAIIAYFAYLRQAAQGKLRRLPDDLRGLLQPHYNFDLGLVRYAEGVNTLTGEAITFDRHIYFYKTGVDFYDSFTDGAGNPKNCYVNQSAHGWCDLRVLAHELQHVYQCHVMGGKSAAILKYVTLMPEALWKAVLKGGGTKKICMNFHDFHRQEDEAIRKERQVVDGTDITTKLSLGGEPLPVPGT